jgi:hypothetical protein
LTLRDRKIRGCSSTHHPRTSADWKVNHGRKGFAFCLVIYESSLEWLQHRREL